jgi:glycosyltransferase involved in cell wall biosynthesis
VDPVRRDARHGGPLRLLWLIDSLTIGGAERLAVSFAREAGSAGIHLSVCCLKRIDGNPLEGALARTGVPIEVLGALNLRDRRAFARLRRLIGDQRIELVHAHLTYSTIWGAVAARLGGIPCVATLHVHPTSQGPWHRDWIRERLMCALLKRTRSTAIAVSEAQRGRYVRQRLLAADRVVVVRNGIDVRHFPTANIEAAAALRRGFAIPAGAPVIFATAVLREPRKGIHVLLDAMPRVLAACPAAHLIVVGDGAMRPTLQAQARQLGLDRSVHWAGARDDVAALLAGADVFVHPTLADPLPTVVLEAMAAALPVVATRVDGIPELVGADAGRLVPPGDPAPLATALSDLLADPDARLALGTAGRRAAVERFSTEVWIRELRGVYDRAVSPPSPELAPHREPAVLP